VKFEFLTRLRFPSQMLKLFSHAIGLKSGHASLRLTYFLVLPVRDGTNGELPLQAGKYVLQCCRGGVTPPLQELQTICDVVIAVREPSLHQFRNINSKVSWSKGARQCAPTCLRSQVRFMLGIVQGDINSTMFQVPPS
jgi:hypothetical protein